MKKKSIKITRFSAREESEEGQILILNNSTDYFLESLPLLSQKLKVSLCTLIICY